MSSIDPPENRGALVVLDQVVRRQEQLQRDEEEEDTGIVMRKALWKKPFLVLCKGVTTIVSHCPGY